MKPKKRRRRRRTPYIGKGIKVVTVKGGTFLTKSTYETKYALILENDPNVLKFTYEPFKIRYRYRGRYRNYIPDYLIEYVDGSKAVAEVKPAKLLQLTRNKAKIKAGHTCGITFMVVTEKELGL